MSLKRVVQMKTGNSVVVLFLLIAMGASCFCLSSCMEEPKEGAVIFTRIAGGTQNKDNFTENDWRYLPGLQIVTFDPEHSNELKVLTADFHSARSPEISVDGRYLLFAGQKSESDKWQIWEMNLGSSSVRQVTHSSENCTDPAYLPGGRVVFTRDTENDTVKKSNSLFTVNLDGSGLTRITFSPGLYFASAVLKDGRIVTINKRTFTVKKDAVLTVLRPDGTKAELFYKGQEGSVPGNRVWETGDGKLVFTESEEDNLIRSNIISICYNRPLHSGVSLTEEIPGNFMSVFPLASGHLLVTYRRSDSERFGLYEFDPETKIIGNAIIDNQDYDFLEAVVVEKRERPRKLPSEVDNGVKTGLLLCQDINFTGTGYPERDLSVHRADRIEILGIDSLLGTVRVETDGSFYLKVIADTPFRLRTIDEKGTVMNGPGDWIYLRPNERRGCIGCHEDQEMAPDNRYCLSVNKPPVVVPVHKTGIDEKEIELE